jgi:hypothetical protein
VLPRLQQLTYLELLEVGLQIPEDILKRPDYDLYTESEQEESEDSEGPVRINDAPLLQPLQALTRLVDLRLGGVPSNDEGNFLKVLSGMQHLTHLELSQDILEEVDIEPEVMAGRTQLQHLQLNCAGV